MSGRSHRSTTRANTSSQASSVPPTHSFLFCVNELRVNEEPSHGGQRPDVNTWGRWSPPSYQNGFVRPHPGELYRWHEGAISLATDCPLSNGHFRTRPGGNTCVTFYRNQTLFWCDDFHQFMTVPGDASEYDVAEDVNICNHWWAPSFRHDWTGSRIEVSGIESHLATRHSPWISDLGLNAFANPQTGYDGGGLSGNLALLIGLVAFSCKAEDLRTVLLDDRAWSGYRWFPHGRAAGRIARRGVVVNIYLDPANTHGSTPPTLGYLEWSGQALLQ